MFTISLIVMYLVHGAPSIQDIPSALFLLMGIADGVIVGAAYSVNKFRLSKKRAAPKCCDPNKFLAAVLREKLSTLQLESPEYLFLLELIHDLEKCVEREISTIKQ